MIKEVYNMLDLKSHNDVIDNELISLTDNINYILDQRICLDKLEDKLEYELEGQRKLHISYKSILDVIRYIAEQEYSQEELSYFYPELFNNINDPYIIKRILKEAIYDDNVIINFIPYNKFIQIIASHKKQLYRLIFQDYQAFLISNITYYYQNKVSKDKFSQLYLRFDKVRLILQKYFCDDLYQYAHSNYKKMFILFFLFHDKFTEQMYTTLINNIMTSKDLVISKYYLIKYLCEISNYFDKKYQDRLKSLILLYQL